VGVVAFFSDLEGGFAIVAAVVDIGTVGDELLDDFAVAIGGGRE